MRLPVRKPMRVYQGDTKRVPLRFWTDSSRSTATDVSGRTFASKIVGASTITATVDMDEAAEGLIYLVWSAADTAGLTAGGAYSWDVQQTDENSEVTTLASGPVTVEAQVTT